MIQSLLQLMKRQYLLKIF